MRDGIIPGSNLDFAGQLVEVLPEINFIASVEEQNFELSRWLAGRVWPLKRPNHLTLIGEPFYLSPWAQDNSKSGLVKSKENGTALWALITPRYASRSEGESLFTPGESFAMEGMAATDIRIGQSALLFQA